MDMESKMKRQEVDCLTNQVFEIALTLEEIKAYEKRIEDEAKAIADAETDKEKAAAKKAAAEAKLANLGLTVDDLKALNL